MKKLIRILAFLVILMVTATVVYTQKDNLAPLQHRIMSAIKPHSALPESAEAVAALSAGQSAIPVTTPAPAPAHSGAPLVPSPATSMLGTESAPVVVKLAEPTEGQAAEHEKDRQIQRDLATNTLRVAAMLKAQKHMMFFQAGFSFLILLVLVFLVENVRQMAKAMVRIADATKTSTDASAQAAVSKCASGKRDGFRKKMPPHFYHKR